MHKNKWTIGLLSFLAALTLSACNTGNDMPDKPMDMDPVNEDSMNQDSGHMDMNHSSSGDLPDGLDNAQNPLYEVGSQAIINSDHMEGMKGAEATIVGAYDTVVYAVTYTPANGGDPVSNHKWVIHEELENPGSEPLEPGDEVILEADHMQGMDGVTAIIDSAEETTVYMIDFNTTTGGDKVTNHKWVTEEELSAN